MSLAPALPETALTPELMEQAVAEIAARVPAYSGTQAAIDLKNRIESLPVTDEKSKIESGALAAQLATHKRESLKHYEPCCKIADSLHGAMAKSRDAIAKGVCQSGMDTSALRIRQFNDAERRRQELERQRLEEEARQQRLAEQRAIEEAAQREAERLAAEGKAEEASEALNEGIAQAQELEAEPIMVTLPPQPPISKPAGMVERKTYKAVVIDMLALCKFAVENPAAGLQYIQANEKVLGAMVRAQGDALNIPGVKVECESSAHFRGAK